MRVHLRTVNRFVAAGRPAGALLQARRVIAVPDENLAVGGLLLEMALQAESGVALSKQSLVHRAVGRMATDAAFTDCFMFKNERPALRGVTLETGVVLTEQQSSTAFDLLRQTCSAAFDRAAGVRVVTIRAAHLAFQDRMVVRHFKTGPHFKVALETGVG